MDEFPIPFNTSDHSLLPILKDYELNQPEIAALYFCQKIFNVPNDLPNEELITTTTKCEKDCWFPNWTKFAYR
jgi:hypothetical protein